MMAIKAVGWSLLLVALIRCSSEVKLPAQIVGVWSEERRKEGSGQLVAVRQPPPGSWKQSLMKFELQDRGGIVRIADRDQTGSAPRWSEPIALRGEAEGGWSFEFGGRKVTLALAGPNELRATALSVSSLNPNLPKKEPVLVEAIFVKQ